VGGATGGGCTGRGMEGGGARVGYGERRWGALGRQRAGAGALGCPALECMDRLVSFSRWISAASAAALPRSRPASACASSSARRSSSTSDDADDNDIVACARSLGTTRGWGCGLESEVTPRRVRNRVHSHLRRFTDEGDAALDSVQWADAGEAWGESGGVKSGAQARVFPRQRYAAEYSFPKGLNDESSHFSALFTFGFEISRRGLGFVRVC